MKFCMKFVGLPPLWRYSTVCRKQCKYGGRAKLCGDVTPCGFVNSYRRFGGSWLLYLQGHVDKVKVKVKAIRYFETSVKINQSSRRDIVQDLNLQQC